MEVEVEVEDFAFLEGEERRGEGRERHSCIGMKEGVLA